MVELRTGKKKFRRIKALAILRKLSKEEFDRLQDFAISPYFNKNAKVSLLLENIQNEHPKFNSQKFKNQYVKNFDRSLDEDFTELFKLCQDFLVQLHIEDVENIHHSKETALILEYEKRKIHKGNYHSLIKELVKKLNYEKLDIEYFYNKHIIYTSLYDYTMLNEEIINDKTYAKLMKLDSVANTPLIYYTFLSSIFVMNNYYNRADKVKFNTEDYDFTRNFLLLFPAEKQEMLFKEIQGSLVMEEHKELIEAIRLFHIMYEDHNKIEEYLNRVESIINKNAKHIKNDLKHHLYMELLNLYLPYAVNKPHRYEDEFRFYTSFIENKGYQMENKEHIDKREVRYLLSRVTSTRRYEWAQNILFKTDLRELSDDLVAAMKAIVTVHKFIDDKLDGKISISESEYIAARTLLAMYYHPSFYLEREIKLTMLVSNFEREEYEVCLGEIGNYYNYVNSKSTLKPGQRDPFLIFTTYMRKIIRTLYPNKLDEIEYQSQVMSVYNELKKDIAGGITIAARSWLEKCLTKLLATPYSSE